MKIAALSVAAFRVSAASAAALNSVPSFRPASHQVIRDLPQHSSDSSVIQGRLLLDSTASSGSSSSSSSSPNIAARDANSVLGGAVVSYPGIQSATGTFIVPEARQPTTGPTAHLPITFAASFWVGIDGISCTTASLRGGVDIFWDPAGPTYNAWYQFAPASSSDFVLPVSAGNVVRITTTSDSSATSGAVTIENLSTGASATHSFAASTAPLCRSEAAWAVHDFVLESGPPGMPVPLANFSAVAFDDASARADGDVPVSLEAATVLNINQPAQGGRLTDCTKTSVDSVVCGRVVGAASSGGDWTPTPRRVRTPVDRMLRS